MFSAFRKRVEEQLNKELPFVVYRKPKEFLVKGILQKDDQIHYALDFSEKGFVFAPFDSIGKAILMPLDEELKSNFDTEESPKMAKEIFSEDSATREFHLNLVEKALEHIRAGYFKKVVLSHRIDKRNSQSPFSLFHRLINTYPNAFCYLWHHPKVGMWLGATPEILLRTGNNRLTTMALSGTQRYKGAENPVWGAKELTEQRLVTDYITDRLKKEISEMHISKVETIQAGQLLHLRTKIIGVFKDNLAKCIDILHPTPAVCGLPFQSAKQFILENENYKREFYTGFLGELNLKQEIERTRSKRNQENKAYRALKTSTELFVNLRCMQLKNDHALIYVGGGITKDSNPLEEWKETMAKSKTMLNILG